MKHEMSFLSNGALQARGAGQNTKRLSCALGEYMLKARLGITTASGVCDM